MTHRLTYCAPRRCTIRTAAGFASRAWGLLDVLVATKAGAWFKPAQHDFSSPQAAFVAFNATDILKMLVEEQ